MPKSFLEGQDIRDILREECSVDDMRIIVRTAIAQAKVGDTEAREWVTYILESSGDGEIE